MCTQIFRRMFPAQGHTSRWPWVATRRVRVEPSALLGALSCGTSSSVAAHNLSATSATGNSHDGLPQQLDRAEDRGDHHDHRAGDAHRQNVI
jgi:hypothetical protein